MRVIVFGGAGDMGSRAVEDLAWESDVELVTIGDYDRVAARRVADGLREAPAAVNVCQVDANDHDALVRAMEGYDVAASALGPFYRFESRLARAAIEAGVDYVSICDDWTAAAEVIDDYSDAAAKAGRILVTGMGASPGLTNVAARHLARQMDTVRRVDVSVFQPLDAGGGDAVLAHMLFIMSGRPVAFRDGRTVGLRACSEKHTVTFPTFGPLRVWNMGHAEPVTMPRFFDGLQECNFFMGYGPGSRALVTPSRWGLFNGERRRRFFLRLLSTAEAMSRPDEPGVGALRIDVWGTLDGQPVQRTVCGTGTMREATALPLSIGTLLVGRRQLLTTEGGVYAPEAVIDPVPFMELLRSKGIEAFEDVEMTRPLV